jgi:hypothetical protein
MEGIVSIWIGQKAVEPGSDFLRDKYAVEYHDPDDQECIVGEGLTPLNELASRLSHSESFIKSLLQMAASLRLTSALWVMAQYDFSYDPNKAGLSVTPEEPLFVGAFEWHE